MQILLPKKIHTNIFTNNFTKGYTHIHKFSSRKFVNKHTLYRYIIRSAGTFVNSSLELKSLLLTDDSFIKR